jgi:hypothetical protein
MLETYLNFNLLQPSDGHAETFPFTIMEKRDLLNVIVVITSVEINEKLLHCRRMMRIKCPGP